MPNELWPAEKTLAWLTEHLEYVRATGRFDLIAPLDPPIWRWGLMGSEWVKHKAADC